MRLIVTILIGVVTLASAANILDLLHWDAVKANVEKRNENVDVSDTGHTCDCQGSSCYCCVDFNVTFIDLGGPGCVRMKYISLSEGLSVNVSYGLNLLHSGQMRGPDPAPSPTCMPILAHVAEVCARFRSLDAHGTDGLSGCLRLEPKLLGDIQLQLDVGCFVMTPNSMRLDERATAELQAPAAITSIEAETDTQNGTEIDSEGFSEDDLIAVVNESTKQGLAFLGNLLSLTYSKKETNSTEEQKIATQKTS